MIRAVQTFRERISVVIGGIDFSDLNNIIRLVLAHEMVRESHTFLVQSTSRVRRIDYHPIVIHEYWCGLRNLNAHGTEVISNRNGFLDRLL